MALTVTVTARVQTAAKKLPVAEARILADFIRLVLVNGVNPSSAAGTAHARPQRSQSQRQGRGLWRRWIFAPTIASSINSLAPPFS